MKEKLSAIKAFVFLHKLAVSITAIVLCLAIASACVVAATARRSSPDPVPEKPSIPSESTVSEEEEISSEEEAVSSEEIVSSEVESSSAPVAPKPSAPTVSKPVAVTPPAPSGDFVYNSNTDIDNNVFLDALIYTGYNIKKHRADGNMWKYILASKKRGLGYLSKIGYAGGSTGYETIGGKPDIKLFEKRGLVCASYVTYVYFNYLPNVAGIDTSSLARPVRSTSANDWYLAAKKWIAAGYSKKIPFTASKTSSGFINFKASESIPLGSIIVLCDANNRSDFGGHVCIYAGYKNGYNWVTHVGNDNGPEFCAIERMHFGPDPMWPIAVITPPSNIRMAAAAEITVKDNEGNAVSGVAVGMTRGGKTTALGTTGIKGMVIKEGLTYGDCTVSITVPAGYTCDNISKQLKLTTANNSKNSISFILTKIPPEPVNSEPESSSEPAESETPDSTESSESQESNRTESQNE